MVTVAGAATLGTTAAAGTNTTFSISLPVSTTMTQAYHAGGTGARSVSNANEAILIVANTPGGTTVLGAFKSTSTGAFLVSFHFSYLVM